MVSDNSAGCARVPAPSPAGPTSRSSQAATFFGSGTSRIFRLAARPFLDAALRSLSRIAVLREHDRQLHTIPAGGLGRPAVRLPSRRLEVPAASTRPPWGRPASRSERGGRVGAEAVALDLGASACDKLRSPPPSLLPRSPTRELRVWPRGRRAQWTAEREAASWSCRTAWCRGPASRAAVPTEPSAVARRGARLPGSSANARSGSVGHAREPVARQRCPDEAHPGLDGRGHRRGGGRGRRRPVLGDCGPRRTRAGRSARATASSGVATSSATVGTA